MHNRTCWSLRPYMSKLAQRKMVSLFSGFFWKVSPPPHLQCCLQNAITFFLFGSYIWVCKSTLDKSFHFVFFPKKIESLSVSHHFYLIFSKKLTFFSLQSRILVGNKQTKKNKSLNVLDAFSSVGCTKSSKFERVMIVQTHAHDGENGGFFFFFSKKGTSGVIWRPPPPPQWGNVPVRGKRGWS